MTSRRAESETDVLAVRGEAAERRGDRLAGEEPMEIRAAGPGQQPAAVAVTMRTPGEDEDLAAGFLVTEGLIEHDAITGFALGDPGAVAHPDNTITVLLRTPFDAARVPQRSFVASASCGICGKATLEDIERRSAPIAPGPFVPRGALLGLTAQLRAAQAVFEHTGGLHACGVYDAAGRLLDSAEDVGRHNAFDKMVGKAVRGARFPLRDRLVLVSGRVSFEIVQKAAMAGVGFVAAVSAPTDLAVRAADRLGITLVGFLRDDGFNVYTHADRVDGLPG